MRSKDNRPVTTPSRHTEYFRTSLDCTSCLFADFAYRKFIGFRYKLEFDIKAILVGNKRSFHVISYRKDGRSKNGNSTSSEIIRYICQYELPNKSEEIVHLSFVDQEKPMFILMVTIAGKNQMRSRLLRISQPNDQSSYGNFGTVDFVKRNDYVC